MYKETTFSKQSIFPRYYDKSKNHYLSPYGNPYDRWHNSQMSDMCLITFLENQIYYNFNRAKTIPISKERVYALTLYLQIESILFKTLHLLKLVLLIIIT